MGGRGTYVLIWRLRCPLLLVSKIKMIPEGATQEGPKALPCLKVGFWIFLSPCVPFILVLLVTPTLAILQDCPFV